MGTVNAVLLSRAKETRRGRIADGPSTWSPTIRIPRLRWPGSGFRVVPTSDYYRGALGGGGRPVNTNPLEYPAKGGPTAGTPNGLTSAVAPRPVERKWTLRSRRAPVRSLWAKDRQRGAK